MLSGGRSFQETLAPAASWCLRMRWEGRDGVPERAPEGLAASSQLSFGALWTWGHAAAGTFPRPPLCLEDQGSCNPS